MVGSIRVFVILVSEIVSSVVEVDGTGIVGSTTVVVNSATDFDSSVVMAVGSEAEVVITITGVSDQKPRLYMQEPRLLVEVQILSVQKQGFFLSIESPSHIKRCSPLDQYLITAFIFPCSFLGLPNFPIL